ncbi:MAG TPA: hypothetical protein VGE06_09465, partial [Flavisolibacter sp.]
MIALCGKRFTASDCMAPVAPKGRERELTNHFNRTRDEIPNHSKFTGEKFDNKNLPLLSEP